MRANGLHLMCCYLECALTHGGAHADCTCAPHAASGVLCHLDLMTTSEVMLLTANVVISLQIIFLK
jgi:hypothetical protein